MSMWMWMWEGIQEGIFQSVKPRCRYYCSCWVWSSGILGTPYTNPAFGVSVVTGFSNPLHSNPKLTLYGYMWTWMRLRINETRYLIPLYHLRISPTLPYNSFTWIIIMTYLWTCIYLPTTRRREKGAREGRTIIKKMYEKWGHMQRRILKYISNCRAIQEWKVLDEESAYIPYFLLLLSLLLL